MTKIYVMSTKTNTVVHRWFQQLWNEGNKSIIDELMTKDVIAYGIGADGKTQGIEAFKAYYDEMRTQLTNVHIKVDKTVCQDNFETALCSVTATDVATGKNVAFSGLCMVRLEDGKIAEGWNQYDFLGMYQQLGYKLVN